MRGPRRDNISFVNPLANGTDVTSNRTNEPGDIPLDILKYEDTLEAAVSEINHDVIVDMKSLTPELKVAVVGSGYFGRALADRLSQCGVEVTVGSRNQSQVEGTGWNVVSVEEALQEKLIILAVPSFAQLSLPDLQKIGSGAVLVDCSNRPERLTEDELSQAEILQQNLPGVRVVKGLNTLSAYQLEQGLGEGTFRPVPIASNSVEAKQIVTDLLSRIGLSTIDYGRLNMARQIEAVPLSLFPQWRTPLLISTILWIILFFIGFSRYQFCSNNKLGWTSKGLAKMPLKHVNKACDSHALIMLSACYLPGILAAYIQLARGTKYSRFPSWLDQWLKMRKQLGLLMLLSVSIHVFLYMLVWKLHEDITWDIAIFITSGVLAYIAAVILGITTLPSVSSTLSWREFRCIQSWLGWFCLLLATTHVLCNGWGSLLTWRYCIFPSSTQLPVVFPLFTISLKVPLLIPLVDKRLTNIRQGREFLKQN